MRRRRFIQTTGGLGIAGLAGCVSSENDDLATEDGPVAVIESAVDTWNELVRTRASLYHSSFHDGDNVQEGETSTSLVEEDPAFETLAEVTAFDEAKLADELEDEQTAIVELTVEEGGETETEQWGVATDDGEWHIISDPVATATGSDAVSDEEVDEEVAETLNVISEVGRAEEDGIHEIRLGVQPASGSADVDLSLLTLQFVSGDDFANLAAAQSSDEQPTGVDAIDEPAEEYGVEAVPAETETDLVMSEESDRYEIVIRTDGEGLAPLEPGTDAEITITTESGAQTVVFLQVPDSLPTNGETIAL